MRMPWLAVVAALPAGPALAAPDDAQALVGAWRIVRYADTPDGGAPVTPFGDPPAGLFLFTADGHASVSLMRTPPGREGAAADPDPDSCVPDWYCSYFGRYTVDPEGGRWTVHVEGGNIPSYLGSDQARNFTIEGNRMTIIADYRGVDGKMVHAERVLVRPMRGSWRHADTDVA
jgi:hypothetical protein